MAPVKKNKKNWREIKEEKKKQKLEKLEQELLGQQLLETNGEPDEVRNETNDNSNRTFRTCSIAVPGSILDNAQSVQLRSYLIGQIARSACIYRITEIIVYDDRPPIENKAVAQGISRACIQFARVLQYLECPQYLRKHFFPMHEDLEFAGLINPLDAPHHVRHDEESEFREGVTTDIPVNGKNASYVNVGLYQKKVLVNKAIRPGLRVTVKMLNKLDSKKLTGVTVSPDVPLKEKGLYWGYSVRIARSLGEVFSKCPYQGGYDLTIGTSDKGKMIDEISKKEFKNFQHCLIVFGGLEGLEAVLENNDDLQVDDVSLLFDHYVNTCPNQGTRTIRTEEAIMITLTELRKRILSKIG